MRRRLLVVCGPTATGKTSLGLKLAREFGGEIVSADSRQVYRGMSIVTGKDVGNSEFRIQNPELQEKALGEAQNGIWIGVYEIGGIKVWGYDLVEPDEEFSVAGYRRVARLIIEDIWGRGKLPVVVGGTGFYIRALTKSLSDIEIPRDRVLRERLKGKSGKELWEMLKREDPEKAGRMNESDRKNPRRLVRAMEVFRSRITDHGSRIRRGVSRGFLEGVDVLWVGLTVKERKKLYARIDGRVEERLANEQIVEELKYLLEKDYLRYAPAVTIGYRQIIGWMGGEISFEEMVEKWKFAEHGYVRRQLTWFKNQQPGIVWFDVSCKGLEGKVIRRVKEWLGVGLETG